MKNRVQMLDEQQELPKVSRNECLQEASNCDYTWKLTENKPSIERPVLHVMVNGVKIEFLADFGASVNIMH